MSDAPRRRARSRARSLSILRLAARLQDSPTPRPGRRSGDIDQRRVRLLLAFLDAPRRPLSREHLLQATRVHEDVFDRSIDVQILRLRRKLERDPSMPSIIQTERGVGDVFAVRSIVALFDDRISWSPPANSSNFPLRASNKPAERQYRGMGVRSRSGHSRHIEGTMEPAYLI
jgi:DNA-binding winged helix-turn-helix (wHTH) protein